MAKEELTVVKAHCNKCKHETKHLLVADREHRETEQLDPYEPQHYIAWSTTWEMLECCGCEEVILRRKYWFSEWDGIKETYFPPISSRDQPAWTHGLPTEIKETLEEVYRALDADARRLALMGARCVIDLLSTDFLGDVGGFEKKLNQLRENGVLSTSQHDFLLQATEAGHAAAHRGYNPSVDDMEHVMDIIENTLHVVYVLPEAAKTIADKTPKRPDKQPDQS